MNPRTLPVFRTTPRSLTDQTRRYRSSVRSRLYSLPQQKPQISKSQVCEGKFRQDLFHRVDVFLFSCRHCASEERRIITLRTRPKH
jgi:hypothetical protein